MGVDLIVKGKPMKPELIVMLTFNDQTVENAIPLFDSLKDTPVTHWGFKDVGLDTASMATLVSNMKTAGKTTYLEVVSLSEEEGLRGAELAVECGFDCLMGTVFHDSINDYLKDKAVHYFPFAGEVSGHPSILSGSIEDAVRQCKDMESKGVDGLDILSYRYTGDPVELIKAITAAVKIPIVSAGSIDSYKRLTEVRDAGVWGFTIGTAFFDRTFVANGDFKANLMAVWDWLSKNGRPS